MESSEIQELLENQIPGCRAQVETDGSHVNVMIVSTAFEGLNTLKKQQLVYGAFGDLISNGTIHAVHMKTYTPAEWQAEHA
ncbi:BolA family protein [Aurantivibrio plasticivorans]